MTRVRCFIKQNKTIQASKVQILKLEMSKIVLSVSNSKIVYEFDKSTSKTNMTGLKFEPKNCKQTLDVKKSSWNSSNRLIKVIFFVEKNLKFNSEVRTYPAQNSR